MQNMKTIKKIGFLWLAGMALSVVLFSCEENPDVNSQEDILPKSFSVDIPASISGEIENGRRINGRLKADSANGNEVYSQLRTFIAVGKEASRLVEGIINGIRIYKINRVVSMTFISDDDHRTKNLVVTADVTFENTTWDYELTVTDADSQGQPDGGKALQIFWNHSLPVEGIAIIKPYNCDRIKNSKAADAMFRIDYSEAGSLGYDAQMEVRISGLPLPSPLEEPYAMNTLRMFAGKKGDVVDVYGNSNHPNAALFTTTHGFNWAFVASGNETKDVGVAEVGLPSSSLNTSDRNVILKENSIKNVFTREITAIWPGIDQNLLAQYLKNTAAPGYFDNGGFISGGTSPGAAWDALASRLPNLSPYNPKEVSEMKVSFK
jgi:hypothetical protein